MQRYFSRRPRAGRRSSPSATALHRTPFAGSGSGLYGYASGTSFAAPEVAGAAALVWAANPTLAAVDVAAILKRTASGTGTWTPELGYGVIDVARAVAEAAGTPVAAPAATALQLRGKAEGRRLRLAATLDAPLGPSRGARALDLDAWDGHSWRPVESELTGTDGLATWTLAVGRGSYRLRARFAGASDLAAATSAPVALSVR